MGESKRSGRNSGLESLAENVIGPANLAVILNWPPRFVIRADNRRFPLSPLSRNRFCVTGPLTQSRSFFSTTLFLSGPDSGLVSVRQARYQLSLASFDLRGFP